MESRLIEGKHRYVCIQCGEVFEETGLEVKIDRLVDAYFSMIILKVAVSFWCTGATSSAAGCSDGGR